MVFFFERGTIREVHSDTVREGDPRMGGVFHGAYQRRTLSVYGLAEIELCLFDNPQILNALRWKVPALSRDVGGLVYANYRPVLFDTGGKRRGVPFIVPTGARLRTQKSIVGHNEIKESVLTPYTFHQHFA